MDRPLVPLETTGPEVPRRALRRRYLLIAFLALAAGVGRAGGDLLEPAPLSAYDGAQLARAVEGARRRLSRPDCAALLDEFADPSGISLRKRLERTGCTIEQWLGHIRFVDGSRSRRCESTPTYAFTARGSLVVYVCPRHLSPASLRDAARAEAVIIHELLHTLGLGEDPPASCYIQARVEAQCYARP
jgi:hypothetical protein